MLTGDLYNALDTQLAKGRRQERDLIKELNESRDEEQERRVKIINLLFASVGRDVWIEPPFYCDYGSNIFLGDKVYFNFNCLILDPAKVIIGDNVLFGPNVQIYTATHPLSHAERQKGLELAKPIEIGSDVWVGGSTVISPGVRIGSRSVIGAGSVVTKDVPDSVFAAGNPCRVLRELE